MRGSPLVSETTPETRPWAKAMVLLNKKNMKSTVFIIPVFKFCTFSMF